MDRVRYLELAEGRGEHTDLSVSIMVDHDGEGPKPKGRSDDD